MKYSVDKIENDIVILEDINSGNMKEENISIFNFEVNEKDILLFDNNVYKKDDNEKINRINMLREKMNRLRKSVDKE